MISVVRAPSHSALPHAVPYQVLPYVGSSTASVEVVICWQEHVITSVTLSIDSSHQPPLLVFASQLFAAIRRTSWQAPSYTPSLKYPEGDPSQQTPRIQPPTAEKRRQSDRYLSSSHGSAPCVLAPDRMPLRKLGQMERCTATPKYHSSHLLADYIDSGGHNPAGTVSRKIVAVGKFKYVSWGGGKRGWVQGTPQPAPCGGC